MATRCPDCGSEISAGSPAGLCPKCLYQAGLPSSPQATAASPAQSFAAPTIEQLAPHFPQCEILELISKGGMAAVYKARVPALDRLVAIKVLPASDSQLAERFQREAIALARLNHPHIVAVHDVGRSGPWLYMTMEFVDGVNLRQVMRSGSMTPAQALAIVPQMCDALQYAHDAGVVHRDIKPENILLDKKGRVKIADFGLAKLLGTDTTDHALTGTYQVMGTLRYMAPEQMLGTRDVDHRADIYSLGVVFYELLTGELPLGRFAPPSKKVQIDVRLDEVVLRALEQKPEQRFQHASDVKAEVEAISHDDHPRLRKPVPFDTTIVSLAAQTTPRNVKDILPILVLTPLVMGLFFVVPFLLTGFTLGASEALGKYPASDSRIALVAASVAFFIFLTAFAILGLGSIRNLSVTDLGLTLHRYAGPSRFLDWRDITHVQEISPWDVVLQVWLWPGLPPRGSIIGISAQRFFRIDCRDGCWYFCPRNVGQFVDVLRRHASVSIMPEDDGPAHSPAAFLGKHAPTKSWEDRWRAIPEFLRQAVHFALALVYLFALVCVFSYSAGKENSGEAARTWMKVGQPSPWLTMESHRMGFEWKFHLLTWAIPIGIGAVLLLAFTRRLEVIEKGRAHSMWWHYSMWIVMLSVVIATGLLQQYLGMARPG